MKIAEVVGMYTVNRFNSLGEPILRTTPLQHERARSNKDQVIAVMPPMDFLMLAAELQYRDEYRKEAEKLRVYNQAARGSNPSNTLMPFLRIDVQTGRVLGHEGRHRANAIMAAGGKWMRVSLFLDPYSRKTTKWIEPKLPRDERNRTTNTEYLMSAADLPELLRNQYNPAVTVSTKYWRIEEPDNLARFRR